MGMVRGQLSHHRIGCGFVPKARHLQGFAWSPCSNHPLHHPAKNHPAAGLDRVRRRKGDASAAAPHPCPRLMSHERRRRGLVLWGSRPGLSSRVCGGKGFPLAGTGHSVKLRIYFPFIGVGNSPLIAPWQSHKSWPGRPQCSTFLVRPKPFSYPKRSPFLIIQTGP